MSRWPILAPVLAQVTLTFALLVAMGRARVGALREGQLKVGDVALGQRAWPARVQQISNSYHNQLEMPVLFYAVAAFALLTQKADGLLVGLAWAFVAARVVHAGVHVTSNRVRTRFMLFGASVLVLAVMWGVLAWRIFVE